MLSWILLIVVLLALVVLGTWAWGSIFGRGEVLDDLDEKRDVLANNQRALQDGNFDDIKFDVVSHGYRQSQVDALLAEVEKRYRSEGETARPISQPPLD